MKVATVLLIFSGLFCSINLVIGSLNNLRCDIENSISIQLDCAYLNDFQSIIYNSNSIGCGLKTLNYEQIKKVKFQNCQLLSDINTFQIERFTSLEQLNMINNDIEHINQELFNNNSKVNEFFARFNHLNTINRNAFKFLTNLIVLNLDSNFIETIEDNTFVNLTQLTTLDLSYNNLSTINDRTFSGLINLKNLYLYENKITVIQRNAFHEVKKLKLLFLDSNLLMQIEPKTFVTLRNLEILDLSENRLKSFHFKLLTSMNETLQRFYIRNNQLSELEFVVNVQFVALEYLDATKNRIDCDELREFFNDVGKKDVLIILCDDRRYNNDIIFIFTLIVLVGSIGIFVYLFAMEKLNRIKFFKRKSTNECDQ